MAKALELVLGCFLGLCLATGYSEPTFETTFENKRVEEYSTLELLCSANGRGKITYTWYNKQESQISSNSSKISIVDNDSASSLFIENVSFSDEGIYTCTATNDHGLASKLFNVSVVTRSKAVPGQLTQIVFDKAEPTALTFIFFGPREDNGFPIIGYVVGYNISNIPENIMRYVNWTKDSIYRITDLKPRALYRFDAAAFNKIGRGPWKTANYIMPDETAPDPPVILTKPETVSLYIDRFTIEWLIPKDNGMPILAFRIKYFEVRKVGLMWIPRGATREEEIRLWDPKPSFELTNLSPGTYYRVEIRAINKIGSSSATSVIIKTNGEPPVTFQPVIIDEVVSIFLPVVIVGGVIGLLILCFIVDIVSFFGCRCGVMNLICRGRCKS